MQCSPYPRHKLPEHPVCLCFKDSRLPAFAGLSTTSALYTQQRCLYSVITSTKLNSKVGAELHKAVQTRADREKNGRSDWERTLADSSLKEMLVWFVVKIEFGVRSFWRQKKQFQSHLATSSDTQALLSSSESIGILTATREITTKIPSLRSCGRHNIAITYEKSDRPIYFYYRQSRELSITSVYQRLSSYRYYA